MKRIKLFEAFNNYRLYIFCFDSLFHYLRKNKVFEGKSYSSMCPLIKTMLNKTIINTIKRKYYEKNKEKFKEYAKQKYSKNNKSK